MLLDLFQMFGFFLLSGFLLPITNNKSNADFLITIFAQALWVCIIVGYVRFLTGVSAEIFFMAFLFIISLHIFSKPLNPVILYSTSWRWPLVAIGGYIIFIILFGSLAYINSIQTEWVPRITITGWDGILSWNNWAHQLFQFEYVPHDAYYPIGFPMAWSIFYDLQDNIDIWIFPALLMFGLLLFPILAFGCFIADQRWSIALFFSIAITVIGLQWAGRITNGYMDSPVALLMFIGLFWIFMALYIDKPLNIRRLTTGFFLLSIAAVTKQPGLVGLIFGIVLLTLLVVRKSVNYSSGAYLLLILILPSLFSGYVFYTSGNNPVGNLHALRSLAFEQNNNILGSLMFLISNASLPVFATLIITSTLSVVRGGQAGVFSLVCIIISVAGFFAYHNCCSYDNRNSSWIFAFLFAASAPLCLNWNNYGQIQKTKMLTAFSTFVGSINITICIIFFFTAINFFMPLQKIEAIFRDRIGGYELHQLFQRHIKNIQKNNVFSFDPNLSYSTLIGPYHVYLKRSKTEEILISKRNKEWHHRYCENFDPDKKCSFSSALKKNPCALILLKNPFYKKTEVSKLQPNIFKDYSLVLLDNIKHRNGIIYELYVSSRFCQQL
ncbi:hypothetical protein N9770_05795 [Amylibacter sp.]|nr:hypothetical protein [Amylibacter sp.]